MTDDFVPVEIETDQDDEDAVPIGDDEVPDVTEDPITTEDQDG